MLLSDLFMMMWVLCCVFVCSSSFYIMWCMLCGWLCKVLNIFIGLNIMLGYFIMFVVCRLIMLVMRWK